MNLKKKRKKESCLGGKEGDGSGMENQASSSSPPSTCLCLPPGLLGVQLKIVILHEANMEDTDMIADIGNKWKEKEII